MKSRYDYMKSSQQVDIDKEEWPDPLSVTYNDIQFSQIPTFNRLSEGDLYKFWLYMYKNYGMTEMDDVLLNINSVSYIGMLEPGSIIFNVRPEDLDEFDKHKISGQEDL